MQKSNSKERMKGFLLHMRPSDFDRVRRVAKRESRTITSVVRQALMALVEKKEQEHQRNDG